MIDLFVKFFNWWYCNPSEGDWNMYGMGVVFGIVALGWIIYSAYNDDEFKDGDDYFCLVAFTLFSGFGVAIGLPIIIVLVVFIFGIWGLHAGLRKAFKKHKARRKIVKQIRKQNEENWKKLGL